MSAVAWTISIAGASAVSFSSIGVREVRIQRRSLAADECTFAVPVDVDGASGFAYGDVVRLLKDGVQYFMGRVVKTAFTARSNVEGVLVTLHGPWWWMEHMVYQEEWYEDTATGTALVSKSKIILGAEYGSSSGVTTEATLQNVFDYVDTYGSAPFGTLTMDLPTVTPPAEEVVDLTAAEILRRVMRWHPDAVAWWDYSASNPNLYIKQRSALSANSLNIANGEVSALEITPRNDLQVPVVVVKYERIDVTDGVSYPLTSVDKYPTGESETQLGALVLTFDLIGGFASNVYQYLDTDTVQETSLAWWKNKLPWLRNVSSLAFTTSTTQSVAGVDGATVYNNEIVDGAVAEWMQHSVSDVEATAFVDYDYTEGSGDTEKTIKVRRKEIACKLRVASAAGGNFSQCVAFQTGEPLPTGIAQALYDALSTLHYEGRLTTEAADIGTQWLGKTLNLSGGQSGWASMAAVVQGVTEYLESGRVEVQFGPMPILSLGDFIELLRVNRGRKYPSGSEFEILRAGRNTGAGVGLSKSMSNENGAPGESAKPAAYLWKLTGESATVYQITFDPADLGALGLSFPKLNEAVVLTLREEDACTDTGPGYRLVLASEVYNIETAT